MMGLRFPEAAGFRRGGAVHLDRGLSSRESRP